MRGAALNAAASDMVSASRGTSNQLDVSTKKFSLSYQDLLDSGLKLAGQAKVFWSTRRPACRMQKWINFPLKISEEAKETTSMQILRKQFNLSRKCGIWIVTTPNNMKLNWYWRQVYSEFIQNGIFGTHFGRIPFLEVLWFEIGYVRTWCIFFFQDEAAKDSLVRNLKNTSTASSKLLLAAKSLVSDPNAPNAKNSLANAARLVTWNPLALLSVCFLKRCYKS